MPGDDAAEPGGGARAWARRWWRALAAEVLATALLVLLGVAALLPAGVTPPLPAGVTTPLPAGVTTPLPAAVTTPLPAAVTTPLPAAVTPPLPAGAAPPLAHPAFAFGFVVMVNVEAFGPASGAHMNPAVTLAALLTRRLPALAALAYVGAQLAGALLGAGALALLAPAAWASGAAVTLPGGVQGAGAALAVEALLAGTLALLCCALWAAHEAGREDPAVSVKFGLAVAGLVFAGGAMTGASLNPARSFAPALLLNDFRDHWVYWVGPLGGAAAAALLHRFVLQPPRPRPLPESLPLRGKQDR